MTKLKEIIALFWDAVDNHLLIRRSILIFMVWMTYDAYEWAKLFASSNAKLGGTELGLIIAAVTAPISMLMKSLVEMYTDVRKISRDSGTQ